MQNGFGCRVVLAGFCAACISSVCFAEEEESSAADVLNAARDARAIWEEFPGFQADLVIRYDNETGKGKVAVDDYGEVSLSGFEDFDTKPAMSQLGALIMHRMPGDSFAPDAQFAGEKGEHVLGRLIDLKEKRMGSKYRVQGDLITEVNRSMGPVRLKISVIDVERNEEGKVLPKVYAFSLWDSVSGQLKSSETHWHEWTRVGKYDLPKTFVAVASSENGGNILRLGFSGHRLAD